MTKVHFASQDLWQLKHCFIILLANLQNSRVSNSFLVDWWWLHKELGEAGGKANISGGRESALVPLWFIFLPLIFWRSWKKDAYSGMGLILLRRTESVQGNKVLMFLEFPNEKKIELKVLVNCCWLLFVWYHLDKSH